MYVPMDVESGGNTKIDNIYLFYFGLGFLNGV